MIYILFFILIFAAELAYFRLADHFNIIDKPNQRSSHTSITLRGGGIVFYIGVLLYFALEGFQYPWFYMGLTLLSIISFADDIRPQSSKLRLIVHFMAMALMFYQWGLLEMPWYNSVIALVICTGILNAYNFMDGINGLTGGYSLVVIGALCYINSVQLNFVDNGFIYTFIIALLVFNFFNFRKKARCFAGDIGAMSAAFIIVFLLGFLIFKTRDFSYIVLLAVYGVDRALTVIHRLILHENIFEAHRKHLFQLMANELKMPQLLVSSIYGLLQGFIAVGLILAGSFAYLYLIIVIFVLSIVYIVLMKKYYCLHQMSSKTEV